MDNGKQEQIKVFLQQGQIIKITVIKIKTNLSILLLSSCIGNTDPNVWINNNFPKESHYNENLSMKQYVKYLQYVLEIDLEKEDSLGKVAHSWNMLSDVHSCHSYIFAYSKKDLGGIRKAGKNRKKLKNIVLNSFSKKRQYDLVNQEYAGYSRTLPSTKELKTKCNFKIK